MLNRIRCIFISTLIALLPLLVPANATVTTVSAKSAILINAVTGEILFEKNINEKLPMASTTKIMTALLALELGDTDEVVTVKEADVKVEGTSIGLKANDKITLGTLVAGMLLESGNDAANVTATAIGGSLNGFVKLMNEKATEIGMSQTSFQNPSGLPNDEHYSTAYDMARLAAYAIKNPAFREICSQKSMRVSYGSPEYERTFTNHNKLLNTVDGVFGVKTGFTKAAGRCLVSAARRGNVTLVAVTLNAPDDWNDHTKLYETGFSVTEEMEAFLENEVEIPVVGSDKRTITAKPSAKLAFSSADKNVETKIEIYHEKFLYPDVKKGDVVGKIKVYSDASVLLCEAALVSCDEAKPKKSKVEQKQSFLEKIINFLIKER